MMQVPLTLVYGFILALLTTAATEKAAEDCGAEGPIALQVLGSGGPIADDGRASTGTASNAHTFCILVYL